METAEFVTSIAEITQVSDPTNYKHPLLTMLKFILADNKGNGNNQGIEEEDFPEVIRSAIDTPIKMRYVGAKGVGGHFGSIPIGHIKEVYPEDAEDGRKLLIANAVLYKDEYPEEVQFLQEAYASGEAPGISYEIKYTDSVVKEGVQWLKKLITKAATIVKTPAYGNRTALLALASNKELSEEEFTKGVLSIITPEKKGGSKMDEDKAEKKIKELEADAEQKTTEIEALKTELQAVASLKDEIKALTDKVTELTDENTSLKRATVLETRVREYTDAGFSLEADAEKATKKKDFLANMSDEIFTEYLSDLKALKEIAKTETAHASLDGKGMPKLGSMDREDGTIGDLKSGLRALARGISAE